jgi:formate--tetrahydrofolate ligase
MPHKTDLEIAREANIQSIWDIAQNAGIEPHELIPYGTNKAKVSLNIQERIKDNPCGKLILVSAINPTPSGEGKTTMSIGLSDALRRLGQKSFLALREPSLGPVFGIKGGAAGGGYSQVIPMEDINLHFTGDIHAITAANNLLCALVDNHIFQGNTLGIDPRNISIKRCMDVNDRQLRNITCGLGGLPNGMPREDGFDITAASEVMAVLCLSSGIRDLKERLGRIKIGYTFDKKPVTASDLKAEGAMALLLKDAIQPNLVQTLEGTPVFIHGGPFANIAHGCNSVIATKTALKLADWVVTEAGFGADLGAEKFLDIKCRQTGLWPSAVVLVATLRALKFHGGLKKGEWDRPDAEALKKGFSNLEKHIENITGVYGLPVVVAINRFENDSEDEISLLRQMCAGMGVAAVPATVWQRGGAGGEELACAVMQAARQKSEPRFPYSLSDSLQVKINALARKIYGASEVHYSADVLRSIEHLAENGFVGLPICVAKTQYSLSDDSEKLGRPENFIMTVRALKVSAGAGFVVAYAGKMMTMPGLPKVPAAENMTIDDSGNVEGLF